MLLELIVENYAVVEQARIRFQQGLNVLTGETGSGKSIVVDSLGLLLGARASTEMIRSGESKARVSGIFGLDLTGQVKGLLDEAGIEIETDGDLIVEREIAANGKSRAFVANRPVTTAFLKKLAPVLGDIHGQNEQQQLFASATQREMLDEYAGAQALRERVRKAFREWNELGKQLATLDENEQEKLRFLDLWSFQRKEIETVKPVPGEDTGLTGERKILQNSSRLADSSQAAFSVLYEAPESVTTQLGHAIKKVEELVRIDDSMAETAASLKQAAVLVDDAAFAIRDYMGNLEGDPNRLEDIESRLAALDRLKRKYGQTLDDVIAFGEDVARRIDEVENASEYRAKLETQRKTAAAAYETAAAELSVLRTKTAAKLSKQVCEELKSLAMGGTQFEVSVSPSEWSATGIDDVSFLVSPNRGEELKPMERIASGGELSRIALALKTATGDANRSSEIHTLVFDEVDAGVGGAAAAAVGRRLKSLSRNNQVICVTHLAQIAGFADHHYAVAKRERKGRVTTEITELPRAERAREIGRMLSGDQITPEALRQAEQLMQAGADS